MLANALKSFMDINKKNGFPLHRPAHTETSLSIFLRIHCLFPFLNILHCELLHVAAISNMAILFAFFFRSRSYKFYFGYSFAGTPFFTHFLTHTLLLLLTHQILCAAIISLYFFLRVSFFNGNNT